ncbi:MAG: rod shape-determining protein [Steroidobacteraceae bacterium]
MQLFGSLFQKIDKTLYVQIWQSRIKVTDAKGEVVFDEAPLIAVKALADGRKQVEAVGNAALSCIGDCIEVIRPFQHPRTLLADFVHAEELLKYVFAKAFNGCLIRPSPRVIVHPMEKLEGGLTPIERRALHELAQGAGARWVHVHEGPVLHIVDGQIVGYT